MGLEPLWKHSSRKSSKPEIAQVSAAAKNEDSLAEDCCEFIGALVDAVLDARYCVDGTLCPARIYKDYKVFAGYPTRLEKLKSKGRT